MESPAPLPVLSAAPSSVVETPSTASAPLSAPPVSPPAVSLPAPEAIVGANDATTERLQEHIISTAPKTERLQSIQRMVADQLGDAIPPEFSANVQIGREHVCNPVTNAHIVCCLLPDKKKRQYNLIHK